MILIDSSVWIDYFRGTATPESDRLDALLGREPVAVGDLMLAEVPQGFATDRDVARALAVMDAADQVVIGGRDVAIQAARHYRMLRARGVMVRKTIDTLIATRCVMDGIPLLYSDRDFDPFVAEVGLVSAMVER